MPYVGLLGPAARREKLLGDLGDPAPRCARGCARPSASTSAAARRSPSPCPSSAKCMPCSPAAAAGRSARPRIESRTSALRRTAATHRLLALSGVIAGFVAGLLGVGGGIVTVPVLEYLLRFAGVPEEYRMHVAVATSLAAIIPTSISSARTHHARGAVDWELAKSWGVDHGAGRRGRQPARLARAAAGARRCVRRRRAVDRRQDAAAAR